MNDPRPDFATGPIWRDANVRSGPSLSSEIVELLLPDGSTSYRADGWTVGDNVIEGSIISDVWIRLGPQRWCSAVNFDQDIMTTRPAAARI
jgi:hypothetical protein